MASRKVLAINVVETEAVDPRHQHVLTTLLIKYYKEAYDQIGKDLPRKFPSDVVLDKTEAEEKNRKKEVFLKEQRNKAEEEKGKRAIRAAVSSTLRKRTLNFRYGNGSTNFVVCKANQSTRSVKIQSSPVTVEAQSQTDPVIILQSPLMVNQGTGEKQLHPDALKLVSNLPSMIMIPKGNPGKKRVNQPKKFVSSEALERKHLKKRIMRRISPRWRAMTQRRSKLGAKELFKANTTISSLLEYFTDQYMQKGEAGLPVRMEDDDEDPVEESGEYYNRVMSLQSKTGEL